jgi:hypothetical protein
MTKFTYKRIGDGWDRAHYSPSYQVYLGSLPLGVISRTGGRWDKGPHTFYLRDHDDGLTPTRPFHSRADAARALLAQYVEEVSK